MSRSQSPDPPESPTTKQAFELLGDETRAEVLRVLSEARGEGLPPALSFSELRDRIEMDVPSSQFNYHLNQLLDKFIERRGDGSAQLIEEFVDSDEGYALRPDGTFLTRVIRAMTADHETYVPPFATDFECYYCETPVEATYQNRIFKLQCPECTHLYVYTLMPPGLVAGNPSNEQLLERAAAYSRRKFTQFARGFCPLCANHAPPKIIAPGEVNWPHSECISALVFRKCTHCENSNYASVGIELAADSGVISFCHDHGLDITTTPIWEIEFMTTDRYVTVESSDPWMATVEIPFADETLELQVDSQMEVLDRRIVS